MASVRTERVSRLVENYVTDWQSGMGVLEIAQKYGVARRTVYDLLYEISAESGIDRKDLLEKPHKQHPKLGSKQKKAELPSIDIKEVMQEMDGMIAQGKLVLSGIEKILNVISMQEEEEYDN